MNKGVSLETEHQERKYVEGTENGAIGDGDTAGGVGRLDDGSYDHGRGASRLKKRHRCRKSWSRRHGKGREGKQVSVHFFL